MVGEHEEVVPGLLDVEERDRWELDELRTALLQRLQRKGIRSVYLAQDAGGPDSAPGAPAPRTRKKASKGVADAGKGTGASDLDAVRAEVASCTQCALSESRTNTVFGVGSPTTAVMFIGEAPGRDEDRQGEPFVGRAGQLLTKILAAIDLRREDVYITNILKCRPPNNRDPQESEVRCCETYLKRQIELIRPRYICALGRVSDYENLGFERNPRAWVLNNKSDI